MNNNNNNNNQPSPSPNSSHDQRRKGDPIIYIVSGIFFACIISGGVFLGLYIFLPADKSQPWYPTAGLILVAIPWLFWFLTYFYRCFSPKHTPHCPPCKSIPKSSSDDHEMETSAIAPENPSENNNNESHLHSDNAKQPPDDGARRVHFGGVVVISEYDSTDDINYDDNNSSVSSIDHDVHEGTVERDLEMEEHGGIGTSNLSPKQKKLVGHRESEIPLTLSAGSSS